MRPNLRGVVAGAGRDDHHRHLSAEHGVGAASGDLQTSEVDDSGGLGLDDDLLGKCRVGDVACGRGDGWGKEAGLKGRSLEQACAQAESILP